jgi:hypothetical protein
VLKDFDPLKGGAGFSPLTEGIVGAPGVISAFSIDGPILDLGFPK